MCNQNQGRELRGKMSKLKKYLSKSEIASLESLKKSLKENVVTVTCVGLYNHGKSTLLNALIKDFNMETFKTADARETTSNKSTVYKNIKYVDTPGLNAKENDNKKVMDAIQYSDIALFVHAVTTGEFNKKEVEFLNNIKNYWKDSKEFIERTVFILSSIDNIESHKDIENTKNKIKEQIRDIFQSDCNIIAISSNDYVEGMTNHENELIVESNINELEKKISILVKQSNDAITKTKGERFEKRYWELHQKLNTKKKKNEQKILELKQEQSKFNNDIKKIEDTLKSMYSRLGGI